MKGMLIGHSEKLIVHYEVLVANSGAMSPGGHSGRFREIMGDHSPWAVPNSDVIRARFGSVDGHNAPILFIARVCEPRGHAIQARSTALPSTRRAGACGLVRAGRPPALLRVVAPPVHASVRESTD